MLATARSLSVLFCSYGLLILANGLFTTLLSLRIKTEGYSTTVVGLLMGSYFLGMFLGARYASRLIQRSEHIRSFAAFASLMSMSALLHVLWIEPGLWLVLRLVDGFCLAGLFIVTESWLNARAENINRGGILAIYMVVNYLAYGLSQLLLQVADVGGFELFALCGILFSLSILPLLLTRVGAPQLEFSNKLDLGHLLRRAPAGFLGVSCSGVAYASFFAMAPVFAQELGQTTSQIGYFMAVGILGGLALQIPLGKISDYMDRRYVIALTCLGSVLGCVALVWCVSAGASFWVVVGTTFVLSAFMFVIYPLSVAHANDRCDPDKRISTSSGLLVGYGCGAILGPILSSVVMVNFGPTALFIFIGSSCLLLMLYCLRQAWSDASDYKKTNFVTRPCDHVSVDIAITKQNTSTP